MAADEPPYLTVGTDVSAKYKGAFCEAKIKKVSRVVKCKVTFKNNPGSAVVTDDQLRGTLRVGAHVEAKHPEKNQYVEAVINKIIDYSQYTVVFDDGDETTLRRTSLCLKSGRHFAESETLDQLPLTNPEHFGTPVMSKKSKRKRRSTMNSASIDDDSSDDESLHRQQKIMRRKAQSNIGKVVCYEVGDKRKKETWLPCLIVSSSAQDNIKINTKEDYLIRSFKDGRYYQVPKKEVKEFTKEMGGKVESPSLKLVIEKALLYLEKEELPANWDKTLLMGLNVPSGDEDSQESDSDTSDDEPSEEKDRFVAQLYKFMDERGTPINRAPTVGNWDVNLYKLFKTVHKIGGYNRVTNQNLWKSVHMKMGLPPANSASYNQIKSAYKRYLHSFEDFYRKLGCTMATTIRSSRARNRSDRNFIMTRNRNPDLGTPKARQYIKEKQYEEKVKSDDENTKEKQTSQKENEAPKEIKSEEKIKTKEESNRVRTREDKRKEKAESPDKKDVKIVKVESKNKDEDKNKKENPKDKKEKNQKEKKDEKPSGEPIIKNEEDDNKKKGDGNSQQKKQNKKKSLHSTTDKNASEHKKLQQKTNEDESGQKIEKEVEIGDRVKVIYGRGRVHKTYEAKVLKIAKENGDRKFFVHYTGWNTRYDEWVKKGCIMENITEKNMNARRKKLGSSLKGMSSKAPGKRGRPPNCIRLSNLSESTPLLRKNSSSSISSTSSNLRVMRSYRNSSSELPFVNGLEPRRRARRKSGVSTLETSADLDSDIDQESSESDSLKMASQDEIKQEVTEEDDEYKVDNDEQKDNKEEQKDNLNLESGYISVVIDVEKCDQLENVNNISVDDMKVCSSEQEIPIVDLPDIRLEIIENTKAQDEDSNLDEKQLIDDLGNSDIIPKDDNQEETPIEQVQNVCEDVPAIENEECKEIIEVDEQQDENFIEEEETENLTIENEVKHSKDEDDDKEMKEVKREIISEETVDVSLQIMNHEIQKEEEENNEEFLECKEEDEEDKKSMLELNEEELSITGANQKEIVTNEEDVTHSENQSKTESDIIQEACLLEESDNSSTAEDIEIGSLNPLTTETVVSDSENQKVICSLEPVVLVDLQQLEIIKCDKKDKNESNICEQTSRCENETEVITETMEELINEEVTEKEQIKHEEFFDITVATDEIPEAELKVENSESIGIEKVGEEIINIEEIVLFKKETKKKKLKGMKSDKKIFTIDDQNKEEGKIKDGKCKSKKKYRLENEDGEKVKESEGKVKSKKFKDKKNKTKKRSDKTDTSGGNDKQIEGKEEFVEKVKKEKKKKEDKKSKLESKNEFNSDKNSEIKKEKKKSKKNKEKFLNGEKKGEGSSEKKSKKKKKLHIGSEIIDTDSEKERNSKPDAEKIKLSKKGKKKDKKKSKEYSLSDTAISAKVLKDNEHKKQEKKLKIEIGGEVVLTTQENVIIPKFESEPEQDISFLLCKEKVPTSPVASLIPEEVMLPTPSRISQIEDLVANSTPAALAASEVLAAISESVNNPSLIYPTGINHMLVTEAANRHESEVAAVLDNTPPNTPDSDDLYNSPVPERESYSLNDGDSTHSGRESADGDSDSLQIDTPKLDIAESEDSFVFLPLSNTGSNLNIERNNQICTKISSPSKRHKSESYDISPSKRKKKSSKRLSSNSDITKMSHINRKFKGDISMIETSNADYRTSSIFSPTPFATSNALIDTSSLSRPSKFNFDVHLDECMDSDKKIAILQEKLLEIRKTYMSLKAEVALIDRRRKKAKRKIKEAAAQTSNTTVSQPIEVQCSS